MCEVNIVLMSRVNLVLMSYVKSLSMSHFNQIVLHLLYSIKSQIQFSLILFNSVQIFVNFV